MGSMGKGPCGRQTPLIVQTECENTRLECLQITASSLLNPSIRHGDFEKDLKVLSIHTEYSRKEHDVSRDFRGPGGWEKIWRRPRVSLLGPGHLGRAERNAKRF